MGNSHGVIIPRPLLDELHLKAGDPVELKVNKKGKLVMTPSRTKPRAGWLADSKALADAGEADRSWSAFVAQADKSIKW